MISIQGFDLSHWDYPVDFTQSAAAGIRFAYLKASERDFVDYRFSTYVKQKPPFPFGAYHFYRELGEQGALMQAELFHKTAGHLQLPPVCDFEIILATPHNVKIFLDRTEELDGRRPLIYTNKNFWSQLGTGYPTWTNTYQLFVASYPWLMTPLSKPTMPPGWSKWLIWQYTERGSGSKYGVKGAQAIDLDRFNGDEQDFAAWVGDAPVPESEPKPRRVQILFTRNIRTSPSVANGKVIGSCPPGEYTYTDRWDNGSTESWARIDRGWINVVINGNVYGTWLT